MQHTPLDDIIDKLPSGNWANCVPEIVSNVASDSLSRSDFNTVINGATSAINQNRLGESLHWLTLAIGLAPDRAIGRLKRDGYFRVSNYVTTKNHAHSICKHLLDHQADIGLSEENLRFVNSMWLLSDFHSELGSVQLNIAYSIKKHKQCLLKSLYSFVDALFDQQISQENDEYLGNIANETIAEGASYIAAEYGRLMSYTDEAFVYSDPSFIQSSEMRKLIYDGCCVRFVQESEIWIESFDFTCSLEKGQYIIAPPNESFGKSFRLGNILLDLHRGGRYQQLPNTTSIQDVVRNFNDATGNAICHWDSQYDRYVLVLPEVAMEWFAEQLSAPGLLREEMGYMLEVEEGLLIKYEQLESTPVDHNVSLTFKDVLIIKRTFSFLATAYFTVLSSKPSNHYLASNIPMLKGSTIHRLLDPILGADKVDEFLSVFAYGNSSKHIFDIQATPLLSGSECFLIPMNIIQFSHLLRNIQIPKKIRIHDGSMADPISAILIPALEDQGFWIKSNVDIARGEIDLIAVKDGHVFCFENKNALLGTSAFELRSSYEDLKKAGEDQLPKAVIACNDVEFLLNHGAPITSGEPIHIHGVILTTYKLFTGHTINGFPVRNIHDLTSYLKHGSIRLSNIGTYESPRTFRIWENDVFEIADLIDFLSPRSRYYRPWLDSQFYYVNQHKIGGQTIGIVTYPHDDDELSNNIMKAGFAVSTE